MGWKVNNLWTAGRKARAALLAALAVVFVSGSLFYVVAARNTSTSINTTSSPVQGVVYCASDDMRRNWCSIDTRGGVRLVRQRSGSPCIQGRTWGYNRNGIWVDRGCRADFETNVSYSGNDYYYERDPYYRRDRSRDRYYGRNRGGYYGDRGGYYGGGYAQTFYCESGDMRRHWCHEGQYGEVRLVRQRSNAPCIQGRTWGRDQNGVWVDQGCRADFQVVR
jgi:hypothetical protein